MMKKKTIAINALSAIQGGGQVYISNLLHYAKDFPDVKIYIFSPPQFSHLYAFPAVEVIPCRFPAKSVLHRIAWERFKLLSFLKKLEVDLVFCPGGTINFSPPLNCLTAVTFQNMLIFDHRSRGKYPPGYMRFRLFVLEAITNKSFKKADMVIFLTEHAKKIADRKVPNRKGTSAIIPHGLNNQFRTAERNDIPRAKRLPKGEYLLYVSVINVFKAQIEVVRAYHLLCQKRNTKEKLLLVGPEYPPYAKLVRKEIRRLGLQDKAIIFGEVPYNEMPSVYHHAKSHIFASTCETFGITVLECLGSGRPLFLSNRPPMPELAGDAAVYFDPYKPEELADLLSRYLNNDQWTKEMGRRAFERSLLYSWEKTSQKTFQAFESLLETKVVS